MISDVVNGLFEFGGALALVLHCFRLYQDKEVRGVSYLPFIFFTMWGWWNLYFYSNLNCWWSLVGGLCLVGVNTFYCGQLLWYWKLRRTLNVG